MAEFCRTCFISKLYPTQDEIRRIVMSDFDDYCEGCGSIGKIVDHLASDHELENMHISFKPGKDVC